MQDRFQRSRIDLKFIVSDIKSPQIQCQSETAPGGGDSRTRGEEPDLAGTVTAGFVPCTVVQVSDSYLSGVKLHTCTIDIVPVVFKLQRLIPFWTYILYFHTQCKIYKT